jgi:hypothetical protein
MLTLEPDPADRKERRALSGAVEERLRIQERTPQTEITDVWALVDQPMLACEQGRVKDALELWKRAERTLRAARSSPGGRRHRRGVERSEGSVDAAIADMGGQR